MKIQRIAFVVNTLTHGGAEIQVSRLAKGFKRRGCDVTVISMVRPDALVEELQAAGIEVSCLNMKPGIPNPAAILRLGKILSQFRPQVVHSHIAHANILSRVTRVMSGFPVLICTAHSIKEGGRMLTLAYRWTDWLADLTTNVSRAGVERQLQHRAGSPQRMRFVPNGLDLEHFRPEPHWRAPIREELKLGTDFVWLAVGRMEPPKDYPTMIEAFAEVVAQCSDATLLIAGRGACETGVRDAIQRHGVANRVRLLGVRPDVHALMNAADGYVMSSQWEGMPLVLQEASAVGLPVVATDVGGNREVVVPDESGLIVPSRDPHALALAMQTLMAMPPARRAEMGRRGRAHVEALFGIEHVLDLWESIYAELLARKGERLCA
jgi:glycosyltransferase involved in cell wall biosynthesis